ncbi:MAG: cupredoxin domain-containing protein [Chloroflexi bacterium]|nr:cupredoxin domain-containing protein [Chloroflexota bacterium]
MSVSVTSSDAGMFRSASSLTWRNLLRWAAFGDIIVLTAMGIVLRDRLPLGLAVLLGVGLEALHFRRWWLGVLLLGGVFADTVVWTLSAALSNAVQGEEFVRLLIPASLAAISSAGVIAAATVLIHRKNWERGGRPVRVVMLGALLFFVAMMGAGAVSAGRQPTTTAASAALALRTENLGFSTAELSAPSGQVTVNVDNRDVWWHTFTIDALHVDLQIPSSGKRQVTFNAPAGTYAFYCAIPGHAALGMRGTLTVQ